MKKEINQNFVDESFNGDTAAAEEAIEAGRRETIHFDDLKAAATILPELEEITRNLIEQVLGYLPNIRVTIPFEPFLRSLIQNYKSGIIPKAEFKKQMEDHVKLIRNSDMVHNLDSDYHPSIYRNYHQGYYLYGHLARNRICWAFGYEPELIHSLVAEMWLRKTMATDNLPLPSHLTQIDFKVMTLIRYREILLSQGKQAADASPLLPKFND